MAGTLPLKTECGAGVQLGHEGDTSTATGNHHDSDAYAAAGERMLPTLLSAGSAFSEDVRTRASVDFSLMQGASEQARGTAALAALHKR
jgi:hypothetical protein